MINIRQIILKIISEINKQKIKKYKEMSGGLKTEKKSILKVLKIFKFRNRTNKFLWGIGLLFSVFRVLNNVIDLKLKYGEVRKVSIKLHFLQKKPKNIKYNQYFFINNTEKIKNIKKKKK